MEATDFLEVLESGAALSVLVRELSKGVGLEDIDEAISFVKTLPAAAEGIDKVPAQIEDLDEEEIKAAQEILKKYGITEDEKQKEAFLCFMNAGMYAAKGALILT